MAAYTVLCRSVATSHGIDPNLLEALVLQESGGNPWAWNPEPHYRYFWDVRHHRPFRALTSEERQSERPPKDFPCLAGDPDQEWWAQQASWGLLQLMGAVARELGFKNPYLPELCDPQVNLTLGARHLGNRLRWAAGDTKAALSAYNAGTAGGPAQAILRAGNYATEVLQKYEQLVKASNA